ncbi:Protein lifeguard 4 [Geodia barretti]|uniref:Protein lifeguard 4 n=1 Tax=Geodia barretti TaxID=519541 RepID=A0AA35X198_GEOBA|nr:Protein lifeguard 4 [Geodia barretti]
MPGVFPTCSANSHSFPSSHSPLLGLVLVVGALVSLFALLAMRHQTPANYYLLATFTFLEGLSVGVVVTHYDLDLVVKAFVITTGVFLALTAYTMQSKYDFSTWGASLFALLWVLLLASLLQIFFWSEALEFVISVGGALLFCGFILFDTHLIMHKLSPEEYVMASVNLYLDFINLFIYILRILQHFRRD